jgi:hypothetical protein
LGEEDVDDENDVRYFLGGQDDNGEEGDVYDEQTDDNDDFDDEIDIELEDSDEDEFSVVEEEKENEEDEEGEQFTDEISSEDDEDLDDLRNAMDPSGTCLVCLNSCKAWSNDLFLYTCHCVYRIHPECFKMWRLRTGTNRVCLICQESLDPHSEDRNRPQLILINHGIDARLDGYTRKICTGVMLFCIGVAIYLILYLLVKHASQLLQASS